MGIMNRIRETLPKTKGGRRGLAALLSTAAVSVALCYGGDCLRFNYPDSLGEGLAPMVQGDGNTMRINPLGRCEDDLTLLFRNNKRQYDVCFSKAVGEYLRNAGLEPTTRIDVNPLTAFAMYDDGLFVIHETGIQYRFTPEGCLQEIGGLITLPRNPDC